MPEALSKDQRRFIMWWTLGLAAIFLTLGSLSISQAYKLKMISIENHALRMDPSATEPGRTPPDLLPTNGDFATVKVGIYLDGIPTMSIKESFWDATFFVWFTWKGDPSLDPAKSFQVVDGKIQSKELGESYTSLKGLHYQRYKIVARISKFFNITGIPLDSHVLRIEIEDGYRDASQIRFVADPTANISSRVTIPGYQVTGIKSIIKAHTYKSHHGDPRYAESDNPRATFSGYNFFVQIKRTGYGTYLKMFIGLFAGVILTLSSFFARASDLNPRFGMPSAAYFGAVANAYVVSARIPDGTQFVFVDFITGLGLGTIAICVGATLVSSHFDLRLGKKYFAERLDRASVTVIGIGYATINIILPVVILSR